MLVRLEEEILRKSAKLGLKAYKVCLKKEHELRCQLKGYLERLIEVHEFDKELIEKINVLETKVNTLKFANDAEGEFCVEIATQEKVKEFLEPLELEIDIKECKFIVNLCQEIDYFKDVWKTNVEQSLLALEYMGWRGIRLNTAKCDDSLLLVLAAYYKRNIYAISERINVIENITFPKTTIYKHFQLAFSEDASYMDMIHFWENELPEYIIFKTIK